MVIEIRGVAATLYPAWPTARNTPGARSPAHDRRQSKYSPIQMGLVGGYRVVGRDRTPGRVLVRGRLAHFLMEAACRHNLKF